MSRHYKEQPLPKKMVENGIEYILDEETQTYIPNFEEDEPVQIGRFGQMRERYLKENLGAIYSQMLLQNTLTAHLIEVDELAHKRIDSIVQAMAAADGTDENLKVTDQMEWVGRMNNYRAAAEEIVLKELIFV